MPRKKKNNSMPDYAATEEQQRAYRYCVRRDIKISPGGVAGVPNQWSIDICLDGRKWTKSPKTFGRDEIWEVFYNYCMYYYAKKKN